VTLSADVVVRTRVDVVEARAVGCDVRAVSIITRVGRHRRRVELVALAVHDEPGETRETWDECVATRRTSVGVGYVCKR